MGKIMKEKILWEGRFFLPSSAVGSWRIEEESLGKQNVSLIEFIIAQNQS
jgi:hypothetical protein